MYTDSLMDTTLNFNSRVRDRFPGKRILIYFATVFNSFQDSNEEKWVVTEGRGSIVKCRETLFEGEGVFENPVGLFHV